MRKFTFFVTLFALAWALGSTAPALADTCCYNPTTGGCKQNVAQATCPSSSTFFPVSACTTLSQCADAGCCHGDDGSCTSTSQDKCSGGEFLYQYCENAPICSLGCCVNQTSGTCSDSQPIVACVPPNQYKAGMYCNRVAGCPQYRASQPTTPPTSTPPAQTPTGSSGGGTTQAKTGISIPNPLGNCNDASCVISRVIRAILGVVAVVATFMFIWGGVLMLTSGGNERQVRQAKDTLTWAAIGIIIIIISWSVIRFVLETFLRAS